MLFRSNEFADVDTITIDALINENQLNEIDILKIDIEGGEFNLFEYDLALDNLLRTKVNLLAIEVHEEYIEEAVVINRLKALDYSVKKSGELLIATNNRKSI